MDAAGRRRSVVALAAAAAVLPGGAACGDTSATGARAGRPRSVLVAAGALRFTPRYPFDPGRRYRVVFTPGRLPASGAGEHAPWRRGPLTATVGRPALERAAATRVERVYPTGAVLPEKSFRPAGTATEQSAASAAR